MRREVGEIIYFFMEFEKKKMRTVQNLLKIFLKKNLK